MFAIEASLTFQQTRKTDNFCCNWRFKSYKELTQELAPDTCLPAFLMLCRTCVTVRADSLLSVLDKYEALKVIWEESYFEVRETCIIARINSVDR